MSKRSVVSLATLPRELMNEISLHLRHQSDLSNVSMVCKSIRVQTLGLLYNEITLTVQGTHGDASQQPIVPPANLVLRTLLQKPEMAEYISTLHLQSIGHLTLRNGSPRVKCPSMVSSASYPALVKDAIRRLGLGETKIATQLLTEILENDYMATATFLPLLCPRITSLIFGLDLLIRNPYLETILACPSPSQSPEQTPRFQHLKTMRLGTSTDSKSVTSGFCVELPLRTPDATLKLESYYPIFYLPKLEFLEASLPFPERYTKITWPTRPPPTLSTLTTLQLPQCSLSPEMLCDILSTTPCLRRLYYDCRQNSSYHGLFDASVLQKALIQVKNTLVHLEIKVGFWSRETMQPEEEGIQWVQGSCSLRGMDCLKQIHVCPCILLGWRRQSAPMLADVLPAQLNSIRFETEFEYYTGYDWTEEEDGFEWEEEHLMEQIRQFLKDRNRTSSNPHLRCLEVLYDNWRDPDDLKNLCMENGLF